MTWGLWWLRSSLRWVFCSSLAATWHVDSKFERACLFRRATVTTITHSSLLPTNGSLPGDPFNLPSTSFHLCSLLSSTICIHLPPHLLLSRPLSGTRELPTLSALSIRAYRPRGLERITFLTSLCQMFMTKIDGTTSLNTKSNNALGLNSTTPHPLILQQISVLREKSCFCWIISSVSFVANVSHFIWNQSYCLHYLSSLSCSGD